MISGSAPKSVGRIRSFVGRDDFVVSDGLFGAGAPGKWFIICRLDEQKNNRPPRRAACG
jgi:hypothetical protein